MSKYQPTTIHDALDCVNSGRWLLPAFQREYVWKHEQVEMLFDSLMQGYPIGTLLFWQLSEESFKKYSFYRLIREYKEQYRTRADGQYTALGRVDFAILDGQQRLTSLYIGLCGTYAYRKKYAWAVNNENNYPTRRLYLDISRTYENDEDGKRYHFEFLAGHEEDLFHDDERLWLRVGVVMKLDYDARWQFAVDNGLTHEQTKILDRLWDLVWERDVICYYRETTPSPDVAVDVFSRINSGGTRLYMPQILMAMTIAGWQKREARNEIGSLVDEVNGMEFYISEDYVLKAFLYLFNANVKFRIANFDSDFIRTTEEEWPQVREAIVNMFALIKSYGLKHGNIPSYYTTLPMLYYLYWTSHYKGIVGAVMYEGERLVMKRWLLKSLLLRTFGYRSDTALRAARRVLKSKEWLTFPAIEIEQELGQKVTDEAFYEQVLATQYDSRQAWVVMSLLYSDLQYENVHYELDHLHPRVLFDKDTMAWEEYNSVLNLQMLSESENHGKSGKPLEQWVNEKTASCDRDGFLESRLIPAYVDLSVQHFPEFIAKRKKMLVKRLKAVVSL